MFIYNAEQLFELESTAIQTVVAESIMALIGAISIHYFPKEINKVSRYGFTLALLYIEVDNFKKYNDRYGHSRGDKVLTQVANAISNCVERNSDYVFRLGGEEFAIIIHIKLAEQAEKIAEKIRALISLLAIEHNDNDCYGIITISTGVAICSTNSDAKEVYKLADKALYQAKNEGKNRSKVMGLSEESTLHSH